MHHELTFHPHSFPFDFESDTILRAPDELDELEPEYFHVRVDCVQDWFDNQVNPVVR